MRYFLSTLLAVLFCGCDRSHLGVEASFNVSGVHDITVEKGHPQSMEIVVEYDGTEKGTVELEVVDLPYYVLAEIRPSSEQVAPFRDTIVFTALALSINGDYPVRLQASSPRFGNRYQDFMLHVTGDLECRPGLAGLYTVVRDNFVTAHIGNKYEVRYYNGPKEVGIKNLTGNFLEKEVYMFVDCDNSTLFIADKGAGASGDITGSFTKDSMTLVYDDTHDHRMILLRQ